MGKWVKGQSGNPGGRPKVNSKVRDLARAKSLQAMKRLIKLTESEDERIALAASNAVLDRALGRPAQAVVGVDGEGPVRIVVTTGVPDGSADDA